MTTNLEALGQAMKRAQYRNHRAADAALRDVGVSLVQWDALRAIDRMPHASGHDLALATFQSDQAFGTLATRLVDRELVVRSPGTGRRVEHTLTDEGRRALEDGHRIVADVLDERFAPLDEQLRAALARILAKLNGDDESVGPGSA
ncbi:MarR family transcriptional regulator [Curtobacterium sp. MCPF17_047]|uniref:MarR family winged helix-turn-helix transcriptional regulator n=1 Tax=unclassified Curtobacterium TaxID=257496 RepID=UPI000DA8FFFD|nr:MULTISPECIES: MarR family winged helix-turn-helix transcriptional regulator [unclassified Curtobacterium]PZE63033.1 MarR family transcriptional regulator [Curtobacterium sp. MCPF17_001]PZF68964.1 MarR family transcriptional regulator [Curtobacterium sp. MCPF17_047]